jgi:hypothetical protein
LNSFLASIGRQCTRASVGSITTREIEHFRNQQIAEGKTATTANLAVKVLRAVFASAKRLGYALTNPAEGIRLLHESDAEERLPFTEDRRPLSSHRSESGIGRFSREIRLVFRPVITRVNQREKKKVQLSISRFGSGHRSTVF